jgi:hypothetical protein
MKKSVKAVLLLILITSITHAQSPFSVGLELGSEVAIIPSHTAIGSLAKGAAEGYSLTGIFQYDPSEVLFIRTGFGMALAYQRIIGNELIFPDQIDPVTGVITGGSDRQDISSRSFLLHIPLELGVRLSSADKTRSFLFGIGGAFHGLTENRVRHKISYADGSVDENEFWRNANNANILGLSYKIFVGMENSWGERFIVGIEPYLRMASDRYRPEYARLTQKMLYDIGLTLRIRRQ